MSTFTRLSLSVIFVIISATLWGQGPTFTDGDYRSIGSGVWTNNMVDPPIWERLNNGIWEPSNSPAFNTSNNVYIQNGHTVATDGSYGPAVNIKIMDDGTFEVNHASTAASIYIYSDGILQVNAEQTISSTGSFEVEDGATVNLNYSFSNPSNSIWNGTENFHPNSNMVIQDWTNSPSSYLIPNSTDISINNYNGFSACFGHLIIDMSASLNATSHRPFSTGFANNLTHGDMIFRSSAAAVNYGFCMMDLGVYATEIGGNVIVDTGFIRPICFLDNAGQASIRIRGNVIQNSDGTLKLCSSNQAGTNISMIVDGDIIINSGSLDLNNAPSGSNTVTNMIDLKGDLTVAAGGRLLNSYPFSNGVFNFSGIGDGLTPTTTQSIDIATTVLDENNYISFHVKNGVYVQQINRDFELGANSGVIVESGGIYDFGFDGTTGLLTKISGAQTGTFFHSLQGSVLKITSAGGINNTGNTGNVQTSNREFNQTAYFHYIGKINQSTGNGLTAVPTGKFVVVQLANNNISLALNNNIGISNGDTLDIAGGKLAIRKGIVLGTNAGDFIGTGRLDMSDGEYRISAITASPLSDYLPQLKGYSNYSLTNGIINLNGNNATQILAAIPDYHDLTFSGNNTLGNNYKGISGTTTVNNQVVITANAIVDIQSNTLNGDAGLSMDSGLLRISKLNIAVPELEAIATPYSLTGGIIELYGSSSSQQQILKGGLAYHAIEMHAAASNFTNANIKTDGNFSIAQSLKVISPAVFKLNVSDIVSGNGSFEVQSGGGLFYGNSNGISSVGALGNVQVTGTRTFSTDGNYGFIGAGNMITGTGLPTQVNRLFVIKDNTNDEVTLLTSTKVLNELHMTSGNIATLVNTLELGISTSQKGTLSYTSGHIIGTMKRWFSGLNSGNASGLFPIGVDGYDRFVTVEYSGSAPIVGGSLTATYIPVLMGPLGLPINNIAAVGSCIPFDVTATSNEGYWQMTDGNGLTGGNYDITLVGEGLIVPSTLCELTALKRVSVGPWVQSGNHTEPTGDISRPIVRRTSATGWSNWGFGCGNTTPLPVELISFTGECMGNNVDLKWSTASEINSQRFVVERSSDLQFFEYVTEVSAAGNSNEIMNYEILVPRAQQISYYRLRQEDYNGDFEYFGPISVNCQGTENWNVYANGNRLYIFAELSQSSEYVLNILDMNGKNVYSENITQNTNSIETTTDLSMLASNMYFVNIQSNKDVKTYKIVLVN